MKKKLINNIPLKLMSVLVAVIVWLLVVNIDDPIITDEITGVVVKIQNESYVESGGQMCLIEDNQDIISVEVVGKRSVIDNLTANDIEAVADLKQISNWKTSPIMVPITVKCTADSSVKATAIPVNMSIELDDMETQEFLVTVNTQADTQPGKGYEVGSLESNPDKVKISGPQSLIRKIDKVIATVDVSDLTEDTTITCKLSIIDKNQDPLEENQISYLKYYNLTNPEVEVTVNLWKTQSDIKFDTGYVGEPADGYKVEDITLTPETITVAGSDEALAALAESGNVITIPDEMIDVSGKDSDFEEKINIEKLLPDNVILTKDTNDTVIASISVMPQDSKEYTLSTTTIQAQNVGANLQVVYETDSIQVRVREGDSNLDALRGTDIKATIDCSGKTAGSYDIPVIITLPAGYELVDDVVTAIKITDDSDT